MKPPKLPKLLESKIYKTGQTRGADDDVIYQNRVNRNSTVLIPYAIYNSIKKDLNCFENGFIILIEPIDYFSNTNIANQLLAQSLVLGQNALVFYEKRFDWINYPPLTNWMPAQNRIAPLGGQYIARIAATTAIDSGGKIIQGFETTSCKGAGIRLYEYASQKTIALCRLQLEALFWFCKDSQIVALQNGMNHNDAIIRRNYLLKECNTNNLLDINRLKNSRIINNEAYTICPLCLEELSAQGFFNKVAQAQGRAVHDLTITQLNLFHIDELKYGVYNHKPYNLGWGHHHCNVVVKDLGIIKTLEWLNEVIQRNILNGLFNP